MAYRVTNPQSLVRRTVVKRSFRPNLALTPGEDQWYWYNVQEALHGRGGGAIYRLAACLPLQEPEG